MLALLMMLVIVAVSTVTVTVTRSTLFAPLRERAAHKSRFLGKLVGCPYCMSHWVAALFVVAAHLMLETPLLWFPFTLFTVIGLSAFVTRGLVWAVTLPPLPRDNDARLREALAVAQTTIQNQQREISELHAQVQDLQSQAILIEEEPDEWPPGGSS